MTHALRTTSGQFFQPVHSQSHGDSLVAAELVSNSLGIFSGEGHFWLVWESFFGHAGWCVHYSSGCGHTKVERGPYPNSSMEKNRSCCRQAFLCTLRVADRPTQRDWYSWREANLDGELRARGLVLPCFLVEVSHGTYPKIKYILCLSNYAKCPWKTTR